MKKELQGLYDLCISNGIAESDLKPYFATIESNLKTKRYGLVWEEQLEDIASDLKNKFPILVEREDLSIKADPTGLTNCLIEGDNYEALTFLKNSGVKVDCIYIDPPYNTGNKDFVYNDKYIDSEDTWRHSSWLSFMNKRLKLAKELLTDDGIIFISISDAELYSLKLLCDSIYGEINLVNNIVIKTKNVAGANGSLINPKMLRNTHEYLLIYCKDKGKLSISEPKDIIDIETLLKNYKEMKKGFYYTRVIKDFGSKDLVGVIDGIDIYKHNDYKFDTISNICKVENLSIKEAYIKYFDSIFMVTNAELGIIDKLDLNFETKGNLYSFSYTKRNGKNNGETISRFIWNKTLMVWLRDSALNMNNNVFKESTLGTLWSDISYGRLDLEGDVDFKNGKKPLKLINRVLKMLDKPNAVILDFFAGSGTTGHAVLELNKEDGGNRKFILCTNNEVYFEKELDYLTENGKLIGSTKKELSISYNDYKGTEDYAVTLASSSFQKLGICQSVTYERLSKVINGYKTPKGKEVVGIPSNLKYYKVNNLETTVNPMELEDILINNIDPFVKFKHDVWEKETVAEDLIKLTNESESVFVYSNTLYLCDDFYESINSSDKTKTLYIYDGLFEFLDEDRLVNVNILSITNEFYKN